MKLGFHSVKILRFHGKHIIFDIYRIEYYEFPFYLFSITGV